MKRRMILATVVMAALLVGVMGISGLMGAMSASAEADDSDEQTWRWLAGTGDTDFGPLCAFGTPCPDGATAASGDTIVIEGEGTLEVKVKNGEVKPKDVDGGGSFTIAGGASASGTWKAKQLLTFDAYGPDPTAPDIFDAFNAGRALILVQLKYDSGTKAGTKADAILEIGCILPGSPGLLPGTIEGVRILISGGQNFNDWTERATLCIDITDSEEEDD